MSRSCGEPGCLECLMKQQARSSAICGILIGAMFVWFLWYALR